MRYDEAAERWPELYAAWLETPTKVTFPAGEEFDAFRRRVLGALYRIDLPAVVVTHGGVIRTALAAWLGVPDERLVRIDVGCGSVSVVEWQGGTPIVRLVNGPPATRLRPGEPAGLDEPVEETILPAPAPREPAGGLALRDDHRGPHRRDDERPEVGRPAGGLGDELVPAVRGSSVRLPSG